MLNKEVEKQRCIHCGKNPYFIDEKVSQEEMLPPFEEWIKKTKPHGGTREEYDKLKEAK
jgi:hypothetical protein